MTVAAPQRPGTRKGEIRENVMNAHLDLLQTILLRQSRVTGRVVFVGLFIFSVVEYWVSVTYTSGIMFWLIMIALVKAWLILQYFMHVAQVRHSEEQGHD
jgi:hypothetical protein